MDSAIGQLLSLDGKTALVTGAAGGIGEAICGVLRAAGANIVVTDIDEPGGRRVAESVGGIWHRMDVTDALECAAVVGELPRLDILVNNAGSFLEAGSILDQSRESWQRSIDVNLASLFNCSQPTARAMVGAGIGGCIVNISSVDGYLACLGTGYDTAKAGAMHFTRSLAVDLAPHGIRVNGVAPGPIPVATRAKQKSGELPPLWPVNSSLTGLMGPLTRQRSSNVPLGRYGTTEEIAHAVLFLCSAASSYMIGQTLVVDGGWTLI